MDRDLFDKRCKFGIRKLTLGVCSVIIGAILFGVNQVSADSLAETTTSPAGVVAVSQPSVAPPATEVTGETTSSEVNGQLLLHQYLQKMQLHPYLHQQIQVPL